MLNIATLRIDIFLDFSAFAYERALCCSNKENKMLIIKKLVPAAHPSLWWRRIDATQIQHTIFFPRFSTERYIRTMHTCNATIRIYVLRPLCLSDYPKHEIKCSSKWQPSYHGVLQFSLAPVVSLYFGSYFRIVVFICRKTFPDIMFCMAAVAKAAPTSKFDLSCRPRSAQLAHIWYTANTHDARTNLMSRFVWSSVRCVRSTFDDYRYIITSTTFTSYAINRVVWYQVPRVNQPFI